MQTTDWYVIQVNTGSEFKIRKLIEQELQRSKVEYVDCFIPLVEYMIKKNGEWQPFEKPMFPGYVFIVSENIGKVFTHLKRISSFTKILGEGYEFIPIYESEAEKLLSFSDDEYNVSMSQGFIENMKIFVTDGPLQGHEGQIRKIDRHKRVAEVEVEFMGRKTMVKMPLEIIYKK